MQMHQKTAVSVAVKNCERYKFPPIREMLYKVYAEQTMNYSTAVSIDEEELTLH